MQLKAVERGYPLYGSIELKDGLSLADALADKDGVGRGGRGVRAASHEHGAGRAREGGRRHRRGARHTAREPDRGLNAFASWGRAPHDLLRGGVGIGIGAARQPLNYEYRPRLPPGISDVAVIDGLKGRFPTPAGG